MDAAHRFFGLTKGYWLRAQAAHDTERAEASLGKALARIKPWTGPAHVLDARP